MMSAEGGRADNSIRIGSRVLIHGLDSQDGRAMNFKAGRVVRIPDNNDLFGVNLMCDEPEATPKFFQRMNLLNASSLIDRDLFLGLQTLQYAAEMRVVRPALDFWLREDVGLLLLVSSFVTHPRKCLFQFGGYMGQVFDEHWCYIDPGKPLSLKEMPEKRLDAASSDMGLGRVLFAGGCGQHPRRCRRPHGFFKSAVLYDSLTDEWSSVADMHIRRHGATACLLGSKVYVLGGMYVDEGPGFLENKFCEVLDVHTMKWSLLPDSDYNNVRMLRDVCFQRSAFFGAGVTGGRIVALLTGIAIAYNPASNDGWCIVEVPDGNTVNVGHSSCACTYQDELVVASGRPQTFARSVAAFSFSAAASDLHWWRGSWRQLPDLCDARVGGSLAVVQGRLYITGGADEETHLFQQGAERLEQDFFGTLWTKVSWFEMPRALHAHRTFSLPYLDP